MHKKVVKQIKTQQLKSKRANPSNDQINNTYCGRTAGTILWIADTHVEARVILQEMVITLLNKHLNNRCFWSIFFYPKVHEVHLLRCPWGSAFYILRLPNPAYFNHWIIESTISLNFKTATPYTVVVFYF